MQTVLSAILFIVLFVVYLILEVLMAMLAYMYLNLYHPYTFGSLIGIARSVLNGITAYLQQISPDLANRADATLLGELGPKSVLLLLIGLTVSALARLVIWMIRRSFDGVRTARAAVR